MMANPFDFVNNINSTAANMMRDTENDELAEKGYVPWVVNLAFTLYPDTILYANLMNQYSHLDNRPQYEFYKYGMRPKQRKAKWVKHVDSDVLDMICETYSCNQTVARDFLKLLSTEQLNAIKKNNNKGGA